VGMQGCWRPGAALPGEGQWAGEVSPAVAAAAGGQREGTAAAAEKEGEGTAAAAAAEREGEGTAAAAAAGEAAAKTPTRGARVEGHS